MNISFHKKFLKRFDVLRKNEKAQVLARIQCFEENQFATLLNNHKLAGEYQHYRSININGDLRALYYSDALGDIEFVLLGTHSELYRK